MSCKDYKRKSLLGSGVYGKVYLSIKDGKKYALKVFIEAKGYSGLTGDQVSEIDIITRTNHPNLVHGTAFIDSGCCIALDIADSDLYRFLKTKTVDTITLKNIMYGILCGISYMHRNFIIHGDLKTTNILMNGIVPKIADFGLCIIGNIHEIQYKYHPAHTTIYRPPEFLMLDSIGIVNDKDLTFDYKVDIWALGAVFFNIVYGGNISNAYDVKGVITDVSRLFQWNQLPPEFLKQSSVFEIMPSLVPISLKDENLADFYKNVMVKNTDIIPHVKPPSMVYKPITHFEGLFNRMTEFYPKARATSQELLDNPFFKDITVPRCVTTDIVYHPYDPSLHTKIWLESRETLLNFVLKKVYPEGDDEIFSFIDIADRFMATPYGANISLKETWEILRYLLGCFVLARKLIAKDTHRPITIDEKIELEIIKALDLKLFRPPISWLVPDKNVKEILECYKKVPVIYDLHLATPAPKV